MAKTSENTGRGDDKTLLERVRERAKLMMDSDRENRDEAMRDLKFIHVPGEQWDEVIRKERGNERPMYEYNKLRITIKRIVNGIRDNRPQGKVRPVEEGDKDTATVLEGLCRNIANVSDFDTVTDTAAELQVGAGIGAWRVTVDYCDDSAFDQDIKIEPLVNPFCLYWDPSARDPLKRDAADWLLETRVSKDEFKRKYPKIDPIEWERSQFDDEGDWEDEDSVRIAEYWWKEPVQRKILLLSDGRTIDAEELKTEPLTPGVEIIRERDSRSHKIKMAICSGNAVLERADWAGRQFPFVVVFGEQMTIDGKQRWFGLTRFAKDAQRSYNVSRTSIDETIALAPQAKIWATANQAKGHMAMWSEAHKKNFPVMLYNADPSAPGAPQRIGGADVPVALIQQAQLASEDIKAVTGIFDNSLGQRANEQSGIAIRARQAQGEIATFNYMDNIAKGVRRTWEIMVDLIPVIYDTQRSVRILGSDGAEKYEVVNKPAPDGSTLNDLSRGKYDVAVTVGPSFATRRQEAAEAYGQLAQSDETLMMTAGDLVYKSLDLPYADEIAERKRMMLPPQIQQQLNADKPMPPEIQAAMAQIEQMQQQVQQQGMLVQQAAEEAQTEKAAAEKAKSDLAVAQANFERDVARAQADLSKKQDEAGVSNDRASLATEVQQAVAAIQQQAADFIAQAAQIIAEMQNRSQPQVVVANAPRMKRGTMQIGNKPVSFVIEDVAQ